jgi:hypothetical protein
MRPSWTVAALLPLLLAGMAGCMQKDSPADASGTMQPLGGGAAQHGHRLWNYTAPDPGGARFSKEYAGAINADEASGLNGGVPLGASVVIDSCCFFDWVEAPDLLAVDQLVALRITLNWTNTPAAHAGLDAAACVPWRCVAFNPGDDESLAEGPHSDVLTLVTSGRQDFLDDGAAVLVGVRYTNAAVGAGLPYTLHVEVAPVGNGLALQDPYLLHVEPNATVVAELVGPYSPDGITAGLMVYGPDDRPWQWISLAGDHGARFNLTLPAGMDVLVPLDYAGGVVRLATDRAPQMAMAHRLKVETGQQDLVEVADPQAHSGDVAYAAPPGSMGDFPFFLYADGAEAQRLLGVVDDPGGANITLASSSGLIAAVDITRVAAQHAALFGNACLACNSNGNWWPAHYLDDDGTYQVHWSSSGAAGKFVMFTQRYVR